MHAVRSRMRCVLIVVLVGIDVGVVVLAVLVSEGVFLVAHVGGLLRRVRWRHCDLRGGPLRSLFRTSLLLLAIAGGSSYDAV